jgi:hypothetical protein
MMAPRPLTLTSATNAIALASRINEFARDVIASFQARPRIVFRDIIFVGGSTDVDVMTSFTLPPRGVWLAGAKLKSAPQTPITQAVVLDWMWIGPAVRIRYITALNTGAEYVVTIAIAEGG